MTQYQVTLMNCADEPIHKIGHIQSCGALLAWSVRTRKFEVIGANSENAFGIPPEKILGAPVSEFLERDDLQHLDSYIAKNSEFKEFQTDLKINGKRTSFCLFRNGDYIVMEHELPNELVPLTSHDTLSAMHRLAKAAHVGPTIENFAQTIADEIRSFTGIDRVMVYRFHKDLHGEVIAEAKKSGLESYLGLHYPESDIPRQARELYLRNVTRLICDISSTPVPLLCLDKNLQYKFDLSDSIVRSVSPMHVQYLGNMGVQASMSVSIILNNKLWGLIACHHYEPLFVSLLNRSFCATLADNLAARAGQIEAQNVKDARAYAAGTVLDILSSLSTHGRETVTSQTIKDALNAKAEAILQVTKSQGFTLHLEDLQFSYGKVPQEENLQHLQNVITESVKDSVILLENASYISRTDPTATIPGVLAIKIPNSKGKNWISWFREEHIKTVRWAGKDDKSIVVDNGVPRLTPRGSFEEFTRTHVGLCAEFTEADINGANEFFTFITSLLLNYWNESKKAVETLLETDKAKDTFIGIISHELRTPLNNILGWIQIVDGQMEQHPALKEAFQVIKDNAANQLQIVNDLLDISRMITGKFHLQPSYVNMSDIVSSTVKSLLPMAAASKVDLKIGKMEPQTPLYADEDRIRQVVRNVIQNAIKFSAEGSVEVSLHTTSKKMICEVTDTGIGIDPAKIPHIFNKFYQADSRSSRNYQGLGLGLAICKNITELSGGSILLSSKGLGKGTTVTITLPMATVKQEPDTAPPLAKNHFQEQGNLEGLRILLVEDQKDSVRFMTLAMSMAGATVTAAYDAHEALEFLNNSELFDIVVSDIGLPDIDGYEFIELAKKKFHKLPPMVALTAHGRAEDVKRSQDAGYKSHVTKPVQLKELFQTINEVTGKNGK